MVAHDEDGARVRLEGGAELLDATRVRYRLLVRQLKSMWWPQRLRKTASVLREVSRVQPEVEAALATAAKHARGESWPTGSALRACVDEVVALRGELERLTGKRLGAAAKGLALTARFEALEREVLAAPVFAVPGRRWARALALLQWPSNELTAIAHFASRLEAVFSRPLLESNRLTFTLDELEAVASNWATNSVALDAVWARIAAVDKSGVLTAYLRARARRTPRRQRNTGPDVLLHAEFWRSTALARIDAALESRIGPVSARADERFVVLRWLWQLEHEQQTSLNIEPLSRAALIELAQLINRLPGNRQWQLLRHRAFDLAAHADLDRNNPDWQRLRDTLMVLARVLASSADQSTKPIYRKPVPKKNIERSDSLSELLRQMKPFD